MFYHKSQEKDQLKLSLGPQSAESSAKKQEKAAGTSKANSHKKWKDQEEDIHIKNLQSIVQEQDDYIQKLEYQLIKMHTRDSKLALHMQDQEALLNYALESQERAAQESEEQVKEHQVL